MTPLNNYLTFSRFCEKIYEKHQLDYRERRLLEAIAARVEGKKPIAITELINLKKIGSPAILHSSLKKLVKNGFIKIELDQEDHRIKYPQLTPKATKLFTELAKEFIKDKASSKL